MNTSKRITTLGLTLICSLIMVLPLHAESWQITTVDSTGDLGYYTSLAFAFDPNGYPGISYYDDSNADLKYASFDGSDWSLEVVDSTGNVGDLTSLAFDSNGNPAISYRDSTNDDLKYASFNGSTWSLETVDPAEGRDSSLAFDNNGNPAISYYDGYSGNIKYASFDGSNWSLEVVDFVGYVDGYTSLAFNSGGYPAISYYDGTNGDLKFASFDGSNWVIEVVDSGGNVGYYTSLAFDPSGNAAISYYDVSNGDLKYAVVVPPPPPPMPDDTMAPTGAIHAHDNMLWPPNNKMVTVTLNGYVVDELSIARDEGGIGVSSAYLVVDGTEIILRDETTDLLAEDGGFSVTTKVQAVKGAAYNVELYATDTEPEEAGGPNSGFVDSTYIRVP